jgi:hypothetical protein
VEVLLDILADLAFLGSIALPLWGMVLCAMLRFGEDVGERPAGQRGPVLGDRPVHGASGPTMDHPAPAGTRAS